MDDAIRDLWRSGRSWREIGEAVGISRNAVLGRLHRLGESSATGGYRWARRPWGGQRRIYSREVIHALVTVGYNDSQIARIIGADPSTVRGIRIEELGLPRGRKIRTVTATRSFGPKYMAWKNKRDRDLIQKAVKAHG